MSDCLFCRIVAGTIPSARVHEDEHCIAFRDINPVAPTHLLVVPRKHFASVLDFAADDAPLAGHLLRVGAELARKAGIDGTGFRLVFNTNRDAGQTVFHVHLHVLGGRSMEWPPG